MENPKILFPGEKVKKSATNNSDRKPNKKSVKKQSGKSDKK